MRRSRVVEASAEAVWELVADPASLARWWPGVKRVEDARPDAWTTVLESRRGKSVRADFSRTAAREHERIGWRQEVEESPFERFLAEALTEVSLEPHGHERTRVELCSRQRLRGLSRFGSPLARRATRRQLDGALEGIELAVGGSR